MKMKKQFSISWKRSKQPRKQRKYRHNAPLHIKQKFMHAHLSKELRKKYASRSIGLRKGDKVKIIRGQFKGKTTAIDKVLLKKEKVHLQGIEIIKRDGTKALYPVHPSNLLVTEINIDDKKRSRILERKKANKK